MTYITYTPIDRQFRTLEKDLPPGAPFNGIDPIPGITFGFALQSRYPLAPNQPDIRFGTIEGAVKNNPLILLREITKEAYEAAFADEQAAREPATPTSEQVDAERDRRISNGFEFEGKRYQSRAKDRENILGAASLAHMALTIGGKSPTDPKWHGGDSDFVWIAEDNSLVPMTAPKVIEFGRVAAEHKSAHTFAARALKSVETPSDYTDDRYWP